VANFFLRRFAAEYRRPLRGFTPAALTAIIGHAWPGNVRELENRVKRAVIMAEGPLLSNADLELAAPEGADEPPLFDIREARARAEREAIQLALARTGSNLKQAAKLLGVSRPTLYDLMKEHQLIADARA
jgi:two-component system, NtrC family, response regulator